MKTIEFKRPHPKTPQWCRADIAALFNLSFFDLLFSAQEVHRAHFNPNQIQRSTLLSIKTGGCSEDCGYCSQSHHHQEAKTRLGKSDMLSVEEVLCAARAAKEHGASRFCIGAAWRGPKQQHLQKLTDMISGIKALGLETCAALGLLSDGQAEILKSAGLDYYNHNLDTSPEKYSDIVSTHSYQDRLDTLGKVRRADIAVCCGGIVGMGESRDDRIGLLEQLANLDPQPESVPINHLVAIKGTPLEETESLDWTEFVRTIAVARIILPKSFVRLSAGRHGMPDSVQALCFLAGANSIFYGDKLLTTDNPEIESDHMLFKRLDLEPL